MRANYTLLLLLLLLSISTFSQEIGIGTSWTYSNYGFYPLPGASVTDDYTIIGEETINDKTYFVFNNFSSCGPSASHLRIEDRKYFMIINGEEELIHDFNLLPGESYFIKDYLGNENDSIKIVVDSLSETMIDGFNLLTQHCSFEGEVYVTTWTLTFVEHVGSIGFILPQSGVCDPGAGNLRCITYSDGQTLKFTSDNECQKLYGYNYLVGGSNWYYGKWGLPLSTETAQIIIDRDTINNWGFYNIMELLDEDDNPVEGSQILLTSEDNKVHFLNENGNHRLLFDFSYSLEIGDTVTYDLPENANLYDFSSNGGIEPIINPYRYIITDIDSVLDLNGEELRRWQVNPLSLEIDGEIIGNLITEIIEGVGPTGGFMRRGLAQLLAGQPESFRCFFSNSFNYSEVMEDECDIVSDELINFLPEITVSPNPGQNYFQIKSEIPYNQVSVINIHGKKIKTFQFGEDVNLQGTASGIYFFKIEFDQGTTNKKVTKI